jgi:hypothetical protein
VRLVIFVLLRYSGDWEKEQRMKSCFKEWQELASDRDIVVLYIYIV